ncbi:MAG: 4Fe-4S dicluster domain-containing protein [Faecalibacterium sp.]|nr:4Fe-4S dicluster domain-containing protein [Ruminococcus sp.]MCM1391806.1 4Fe-4S dicluster domain-containing protein [Ruminococcus sp.]MCM1485452.1 4Fe-4S dicluster domain-containing protein [Faecalibacterium sp.]
MLKTGKEMSEDIIAISGINPRQCMKCGKCSATCPAFEEMDIHPHQFASMVVEGRIDELLESKTLWKCLSCFACVERCPRSVEPAKLIEAVRVSVIRQKGVNYLSPDEIPGKLDPELPQQAIAAAYRKYRK